MIFFDRKTLQNIYFYLNWGWFDALNNRYIYIDNQIMVHLLARKKKADLLKTQVVSSLYSEYER